MFEVFVVLACGCALLALGFAVAILLRLSRLQPTEALSGETMSRLLRAETELVRSFGDEQARGMRQELGENLRGSVRALSDSVAGTLAVFGQRLEQSVAAIEGRVSALAAKLDQDLSSLGEAAIRDRDGLRTLVEGKLESSAARQAEQSKELRDELGASFHRFSSAIGQTLVELGERSAKSQETLRQTVEGRLDVIRQESASKLEEMRRTVDEKLHATLETRLGESFNRVVEQLNRVHEGLGEMKTLASNVGDLRNVLTNVKVRGTFGEVQLGMLLEQFLAPEQFVRDVRVREHTLERVEFAIKYPLGGEEVLLPIDAKFPRETYERLLEASDAGDAVLIESYRKQLQTQIKTCAKEIGDKYICPPRTTDYAILFLPTEGLFAEVLRLPGVIETIYRDHRVTLAGPTTLAATLSAFQMGFRSMAIERRSGEVRQMLSAVQNEFGKYNKVVGNIEKQLNTALNSVGELGTRTRAMSRKLKTVEALPEGVSGSALLGLDAEEAELEGEDEPTTSAPIGLFARAAERH